MSGRLQGRVAIVTGGAQGIGAAIAHAFAREGAMVAIADLDQARANGVSDAIGQAGGQALAMATDVTHAASITALVARVVEQWSTVDILVNSAGGFHAFSPITDIEEDEWDRVVTLNLKSVFLCAKAVTPVMMARKYGRIVSIASQAGVAPNPQGPSYLPYGAAKAGVIGFTRLLARDLGQYGITVNAISPGTTATERVKSVRDADTLARIAALNPMRSLVEPEDSAASAVFLASDEARFITGANLNVNGGSVM